MNIYKIILKDFRGKNRINFSASEEEALLQKLQINEFKNNCQSLNYIIAFFNFNYKIIANILYNNEEIFYIKDSNQTYDLDLYFYLNNIINDNVLINYTYNIEFIKNINAHNENEKLKLKQLIFSMIILELINNYKESCLEISSLEEANLKIIEDKNKQIINNFANLKKFKNLDIKRILAKKIKNIEDLYINIIKDLILNKIFIKHKPTAKILNKLNLQNINLRNSTINSIIKTIEENSTFYNNYFIKDKKDINSITKINFNYNLLRYIIKDSLDIYNIPFLFRAKRIIHNYIKSINLDKYMKIPLFSKRLDYIIKIFCDSNYYYEKYKISKLLRLLKSDKNIKVKLIDDFISNNILENFSMIAIISFYEKNKLKIDYKFKNLDYDFNKIIEELEEIKQKFAENIDKFIFFKQFIKILEFLKLLKELVEESEVENIKLEKKILNLNNQKQTKEIKLDFYKEQNNNSGIECKYTIFSKNVGKKLTYRDENITQKEKNDYKEGLLYLLEEIINEKNDDELEIIEPKNILISGKENISSDNIVNLSTFSYNKEQKHPSSDYDSILSDKTIKKIKQLTNGNFIVICENKLLLLDFYYNYKDIIEYKENIVNAWENIINKNKTELLIKFKNRINLIEINDDKKEFSHNIRGIDKKDLSCFKFEINNFNFSNSTDIDCCNDIAMHKLQNNKKVINKNILDIILDNKIFENNLIIKYCSVDDNVNEEKKIYSIKSENCLCFIPGREKEQYNKLILA